MNEFVIYLWIFILREIFIWNLQIIFSGKGTGLGSLASSQSVSFRQGTNVEFSSNTFNANGGGSGPETLDVAYSLDPVNNKSRDFHNPMYDAVQNNPDVVGNGSSGRCRMMNIFEQ